MRFYPLWDDCKLTHEVRPTLERLRNTLLGSALGLAVGVVAFWGSFAADADARAYFILSDHQTLVSSSGTYKVRPTLERLRNPLLGSAWSPCGVPSQQMQTQVRLFMNCAIGKSTRLIWQAQVKVRQAQERLRGC